MTLYELTGQYQTLMEMAEEEVFDQKTINDTMEGVEEEIKDKADAYAKIVRTLEGEVESLDAEIKRLTTKKTTMANNIKAIKKNLETAMIAIGKTKFKTLLFGFNIQKNTPSLEVLDEKKIPAEFWKQPEPVLDRIAALNYIKANGDQTWGKKKQTESLRIK